MKKTILLILLVSMLIIGCTKDPTVAYGNAIAKSFSVNSGKMSVIMNLRVGGEHVKNENIVQFQSDDNDHLRLKMFNHTETDEYGYDSVTYYEDGKVYIEIPMINKMLLMDTSKFVDQANDVENEGKYMNLGEKVKELLSSKEVVALEDTLVQTMEGKVKAKKFSVKLDAEKIATLNELLLDVSKDFDINLDIADIENVESEAYIDFDGYLVKQHFLIYLQSGDEIDIEIKWWDFGREQNITIPTYDQEDIIENIEELKEIDFGGKDE